MTIPLVKLGVLTKYQNKIENLLESKSLKLPNITIRSTSRVWRNWLTCATTRSLKSGWMGNQEDIISFLPKIKCFMDARTCQNPRLTTASTKSHRSSSSIENSIASVGLKLAKDKERISVQDEYLKKLILERARSDARMEGGAISERQKRTILPRTWAAHIWDYFGDCKHAEFSVNMNSLQMKPSHTTASSVRRDDTSACRWPTQNSRPVIADTT